ncbi:hypothetical protein [Enterococcus sp. AZ163]|uniref:hypothetical protein n=1 Tax=Enterococcus sp. AZ163 TaxID=2774638 RepID=UPI003D2D3B2B
MNTNEIYTIRFDRLNKEAKKLKKLSLKKEMNLSSADIALQDLLVSCAESGVSVVTLSMSLVGMEFGKNFVFEDIEIDTDDPSSLDSVLVDDIYQTLASVSSEEAQELEVLSDTLLEQFQDERENPSKYNFSKDNKMTKFKSTLLSKGPKGFPKLSPSFLKNNGQQKEATAPSDTHQKENDTKEKIPLDVLTNTKESEKSLGSLSEESAPIEYDDIPEILTANNPETSQEVDAATPTLEVNPINNIQTEPAFVDINDYLNIENSEKVIQNYIDLLEQKEKRTKEIFCDLLGLVDQESRLGQKKKALISEAIDPKFYQKVKTDFESNVLELKEATSDTLESVFFESDLSEDNFEKKIEEFQQSLEQQQKAKISESIAQLEKAEKDKFEVEKANLVTEQEEEIAQLKKRHKKDMDIFIKKRFAEINEIVSDFEKARDLQFQSEFVVAVREKEMSLKRSATESILLTKKEILDRMTKAIQELKVTAETSETAYLAELQNTLNENEQKLKDEVQRDLENQQREAELKLIEEQNKLKEREISLSETNFKDKEIKSAHVEKSYDDLLLAQSTLSQQSLEIQREQMKSIMEMLNQQTNNVPAVQQNVEAPALIKSWSLSKVLPFVALFTLAGGSVAYGVSQHISNKNMQSDLAATNQVLSESKKALEQFMTGDSSNSEIENKSYDSLMREGKYLEAAKEFPSKVNEIEQAIFADKDLEALKKFNRSFSSDSGSLDENLLKDDVDSVVASFENDKDYFKNLSTDRKEAVALCLYQRGKDKEANSLLGK